MSDVGKGVVSILAIDDEEQVLLSYDTALEMAGFPNVICCSDSRNAMDVMLENSVSIVLLDLAMPGVSGDELLGQIVESHPGVPVVVITGNADIGAAVQCMKAGAFDFLVKPVMKERLIATVRHAMEFSEISHENELLREGMFRNELRNPEAFSEMVTDNTKMQSVFQYAEAISNSTRPVLITGETGTGKELLARAIHRAGGRPGPFVPVNVAGLDDNAFSDTLFGHLKGAFTGAETARKGMVEQAGSGTLFLDEVGDMLASVQVKLLRLLQDGEYQPLGAEMPLNTDARVIVATNQDLDSLQTSGGFRKDLYYRLCTHRIHIPPLRERLDDLPLLLNHFLDDAAVSLGKAKPRPPKELVAVLSNYDFPGNVRELQALVYDAVSRHSSMMLSMDVFKDYVFKSGGSVRTPVTSDAEMNGDEPVIFGSKLPTMKEAKDRLIEEALRRANGNKTLAASMLGMTRQALNRRARVDNVK